MYIAREIYSLSEYETRNTIDGLVQANQANPISRDIMRHKHDGDRAGHTETDIVVKGHFNIVTINTTERS